SAPATSGTTSLPCRANVRHEDRWLAFTPCRRATSFTVTPGTRVSATIRPFASSDQRRFAAGAAKSSTNPTASMLRSRWTPNETSHANLRKRAHRSLRIQREGGVRTALTLLQQRPLRNTLIEKGVLREEGDFLIFTSDYSFTSASAAAATVIGASAN